MVRHPPRRCEGTRPPETSRRSPRVERVDGSGNAGHLVFGEELVYRERENVRALRLSVREVAALVPESRRCRMEVERRAVIDERLDPVACQVRLQLVATLRQHVEEV